MPMSDFLHNAKLSKKYNFAGDGAYLAHRLSKRYHSEGLAFSSRTYPVGAAPIILVYDASKEDRVKKGWTTRRDAQD